jgi:hypothetical protein
MMTQYQADLSLKIHAIWAGLALLAVANNVGRIECT